MTYDDDGIPPGTAPDGYIICNDEAIYGVGASVRDAWLDWQDNVEPGSDEDDFKCLAATLDLLLKVEAEGGAIAWGQKNGRACTVAEEEGDAA